MLLWLDSGAPLKGYSSMCVSVWVCGNGFHLVESTTDWGTHLNSMGCGAKSWYLSIFFFCSLLLSQFLFQFCLIITDSFRSFLNWLLGWANRFFLFPPYYHSAFGLLHFGLAPPVDGDIIGHLLELLWAIILRLYSRLMCVKCYINAGRQGLSGHYLSGLADFGWLI